jgi:predicted DsbA family dithiol-disulfide isomerase
LKRTLSSRARCGRFGLEITLSLTIDLVHDTVCPWCRIGKKNLDDALASWDGEAAEITYHPFFLHPGMPSAGRPFRDHMRSVKGDDDIEPMLLRVANTGLQAGLNFRWDLVQRAPNTLHSHALVLAAPGEVQGAVLDAVHKAYFEQGIDIGSKANLTEIVKRLGVDTDRLDDQAFLDDVAGAAEGARAQGIEGVPFFIFNQQLAVSGAQPASVLLGAIEQATAQTVVS